ncbi:MAG TPA: sensor histidine kinase [Streptosporangiaceae bacterium]
MKERLRRWLLRCWPCLPFLAVGLMGTGPAAALQPDAARPPEVLAYALVVVAILALTVRPPETVLAIGTAAVAAYLAAGYPYGPILLTIPVAGYLMAAWRPPRRAGAATTVALAVLFVAAFAKRVREPLGLDGGAMFWQAAGWTAIVAAAFAIGAAVRVRRVSAAGMRAEQARRVASEERLRMAQDLHDTIGHGLAAIAMQAGVALYVLDRDPAAVRRALEAVRSTSRDSLESLRAQVEALRSPDSADRRPAYGLAELEPLAERVRAGGVTVLLDIDPALPDPPPAADAAAYRIVQEALTNVLRHAHADTVRIALDHDGDALLIDVTDTGRARRPAGEGSGIRGMRGRAEALGGALTAGPAPHGGFTVAARLPLRPGRP